MATPRKRPSSGFTTTPSETLDATEAIPTESNEVHEFLEAAATEALEEVIAMEEAPSIEPTPVPFFAETITPTEDPGPRFVEVAATETLAVPEAKPLPQASKRHPRNIPKFSRLAK